MDAEFNPLHFPLLCAQPQRLHVLSAWNEHVPFAMMLMELQRPRVLVELGTHWGISYCAFCQAAVAAATGTRCYAVDTWAGDSDAGFYGQEVYEHLQTHHRQYEGFSKLLRMTFDDARGQIADGSVDLLHIDGLHSYEAVKHDYETWRPKLSARGVVLFHDTVVRDRGFGVHQLWAELSPQFPSFNFEHGFGLGVLAVGPEQPPAVTHFLRTANAQPAAVRRVFSALGHRLQCEVDKTHAAANRSWLRRAVDRWRA
jgi:hypothetical protein